jgi:hypothetical protein
MVLLCTQEIYDRLEELDPSTFETDAIKLLTGLGFDQKMMAKATRVRSNTLSKLDPVCHNG